LKTKQTTTTFADGNLYLCLWWARKCGGLNCWKQTFILLSQMKHFIVKQYFVLKEHIFGRRVV